MKLILNFDGVRRSPVETKIHKIMMSPCASDWLKNALRDLMRRDCVDASDDANTLMGLMNERTEEVFQPLNK